MYWYQENRIIKRSDFINKYLEYTWTKNYVEHRV
jgi:hypothetical protein